VYQLILKRNSKQDRRRRQRQLLNTSVQVFTGSAQMDSLGINLSDVGMCLFTIANLPLGSQILVPPSIQRNDYNISNDVDRVKGLGVLGFMISNTLFALAQTHCFSSRE
jgi:hypothetical protein